MQHGVLELTRRMVYREYRRSVARHLRSSKSKRTQVEKVMALLIESGVLYFFYFVRCACFSDALESLSHVIVPS